MNLRFASWIAAVAGIVVLTLAWLVALRGERILNSDRILIGGWIAICAILIVIALLLKTTPPNAIRLTIRQSHSLIIGVTVLFHACAIANLWPALSEDVLRYRFDGRTWLAGKSPYVISPAQMENLPVDQRGFVMDTIDRMIPFPILHTIYPPTSQFIFTIQAFLERALQWNAAPAPDWSGEPHPQWRDELPNLRFVERALLWRVVASGFAIASVLAILAILRITNRSPWWAILFAWNPLVILESAGMAHQDIVGVFLLVMMPLAAHKRRFAIAGVMLALTIGVKPIAFLLLPFLLRDAFVNRATWKTIAAFSVSIVLLALPVLYHDGLSGVLVTGRVYSQNWEANGSIYEIFKFQFGAESGRAMLRAKEMSRLLSVSMLLLTALALWRARATIAQAGYWFFLILLLCAPVAYPWYLLWVICFMPFLSGPQGLSGLVWSGTIALCYVLWRTNDWQMPKVTLLWEYVPVYLILGIELIVLCAIATPARDRSLNPLPVLRERAG